MNNLINIMDINNEMNVLINKGNFDRKNKGKINNNMDNIKVNKISDNPNNLKKREV